MRAGAHLRLLILVLVVWAAFWVAGWPDYYQQYSFRTQIVICVLVLVAFAWQGVRFILPARVERRIGRGVWLAFYFTVPFALLDAAYCGVYLGHGATFLVRYWYLTIFYVIPWMLFVPLGWLSSRVPADRRPTHHQSASDRPRGE